MAKSEKCADLALLDDFFRKQNRIASGLTDSIVPYPRQVFAGINLRSLRQARRVQTPSHLASFWVMNRRELTMRGSFGAQPCWIPLALAATMLGKLVVPAQDWETVDDFALAGGAEAHGVAVGAAGGIYVVGTAAGHGIVRYSGDAGANWSTLDDFVYPSQTNYNLFNTIIVDRQGALFVAGASGRHWIVRRSADQGVTWQTVDDFYQPMNGPEPGTNGVVYSLSRDGQGRVYGAGRMLRTGASYPNWLVRGSDIGGTNWDTKLLMFSGYADVSQITWAGEDVYVTGSTSDSVVDTGLILRSSDYGATWTTNFEATNEVDYAMTSDSAGNVYSVGNRWNSTSVDWLVRKAAPGGTNWTILDRSSYDDSSGGGVDQPNPRSIAIDAAGNMCAAGQFLDHWVIYGTNSATYGANWTWFTRQYSVASGQWSTTDLFPYSTNSTNTHAAAMGTAIAPDGSTFVVGYGTSDSGQRRWVVRKRAASIDPPRLQIALGNRSIGVSWPAAVTNSILEWADSPGVNQQWQVFTGTVSAVEGRNTATFELTPGARCFRLKSATGH